MVFLKILLLPNKKNALKPVSLSLGARGGTPGLQPPPWCPSLLCEQKAGRELPMGIVELRSFFSSFCRTGGV